MQTMQNSKILIVDDTPTNLEVLSNALISANYQVAVALDGESAIAQIKYKPPELVLLDVMMPGINGFETCRRLKADANTSHIPIIFMTALSDTVDKVKGLSLGAVDYITKPFQQEEVMARVKVHLELYHLKCTLEQQVKERTSELSNALANLKNSQLQLIQGEKMSSLGQLVAGIAHEINNPVNFIHGNLPYANEYVNNLLALVNQFHQELQRLYQKFPDETNPEIEYFAEEIDLEFLQTDLPKLLESMGIGTKRIRDLVYSLRNFSRTDEAESKSTNLHEGIDSTLILLGHRLNKQFNLPTIQIVKEYGNIPDVECYPSSLNQVFMNILANAIDALEEAMEMGKQEYPTIWISTKMVGEDQVKICIANNGLSIPAKAQESLFEPFFTTKAVGKGTGMGMSISQEIVVTRHKGSINFTSVPGKNTEFVVQIGVNLPT